MTCRAKTEQPVRKINNPTPRRLEIGCQQLYVTVVLIFAGPVFRMFGTSLS